VPTFGERSRREWEAYASYNDSFAAAIAEEAAPGAAVLVQDYHLSLTPRQLRERRPDLRISHFSHTPWAPPEYFRLLPDVIAVDLLTGLLGADAVGFNSSRWADAFARCCVDVLGASYDGKTVTYGGRTTRVDVHPLGVDGPELAARAAEADVTSKLPAIRELAGDRQLILRVDRTELSKNIVRGLEAYRELLRRWPEHRERVVHLAFAYPSRHDLPEYREYTGAVQRVAREVNEEFATPGWVPVHLEVKDDYPRSLAAMQLADVLVVNPLRDGMNLVAKEGPVLSDNGVGLVLSREAGAADDLGPDALLVNPYDVSQTAEALHEALLMDRSQRAERSKRLAEAAMAFPPSRWLADQLTALEP
jgi:trehalose 6-phosphate synthase